MTSLIYTIITEFFSLLWALLSGYFYYGFFFLILHLFVGYLIRRSWRDITAEETALNNWITKVSEKAGSSNQQQDEKQAVSNEHKTIDILDQFIEECGDLGKQGILVPITDFSDRLDSTVDGLVAKLHDRTNLFLIVGIAGTLFGVFEFAFKSYLALTTGVASERVPKLAEYLSGSMSKAFPVGFMGLVLTFISQIIATRPEAKLRKVIAEATLVALKKRQVAIKSQAKVIQEAANAIIDGLKPLSDLKGTLEQSIQPVIEIFGQRLDGSLKLIEKQFERLEGTNKDFQTTVASLQNDIKSLHDVADSLKVLTKDTPKIIQNVLEQQQKHLGVFEEQINQAGKINKALDRSIEEINKLNQNILISTKETFDIIRENSRLSWNEMSNEFRDKMKENYEKLFSEVDKNSKEISAALSNTLRQLNDVTQNISGLMENVATLPEDISGKLDAVFNELEVKSLEHWRTTTDNLFISVQRQYIEYLTSTDAHAEGIASALASAAHDWQRVANNVETIIREPINDVIKDARDNIVSGLEKFDRSLEGRVPKVLEDLTSFADNLSIALEKMERVQSSLDDWLKNSNDTQQIIFDINTKLISTLSEIQQIHSQSNDKEILALLQQALNEIGVANEKLELIKHGATPGKPIDGPRDPGESPKGRFDWLPWKRKKNS